MMKYVVKLEKRTPLPEITVEVQNREEVIDAAVACFDRDDNERFIVTDIKCIQERTDIKEGDIVQIKHTGAQYPDYVWWVCRNLSIRDAARFANGVHVTKLWAEDKKYRVIKIAPHSGTSELRELKIAAIEETDASNRVLLFGLYGLKLANEEEIDDFDCDDMED